VLRLTILSRGTSQTCNHRVGLLALRKSIHAPLGTGPSRSLQQGCGTQACGKWPDSGAQMRLADCQPTVHNLTLQWLGPSESTRPDASYINPPSYRRLAFFFSSEVLGSLSARALRRPREHQLFFVGSRSCRLISMPLFRKYGVDAAFRFFFPKTAKRKKSCDLAGRRGWAVPA